MSALVQCRASYAGAAPLKCEIDRLNTSEDIEAGMQQRIVRLGFLGFGEAAYILGKALNANGLAAIIAYSHRGCGGARRSGFQACE